MAKIPSSKVIRDGVRVLAEVYAEIDKQVGAERATRDGKVSDAEVAAFLGQRGARSETAGEAVASVQSYLRHFSSGGEVPLDAIKNTLNRVTGFIDRDRDAGKDLGEIKPTWRAIALFAQEVQAKNLTAQGIVADRGQTPGDGGAGAAPTGPRVADRAAFARLEADAKKEILDGGTLHGHYLTTGEKPIGELTGPARACADKMLEQLLSHVGDFEDDSGVYGTIGGPEARVEVISLPGGEPVGGHIWVAQRGFNAETAPVDADGDRPYHFANADDCTAAGIDPDEDISWQVHGVFEVNSDGDVAPLGGADEHLSANWEWSGY